MRCAGLDRSLWYDELFTLEHFTSSADDALGSQIAANNHPPASLIAWATLRAHERAARVPSPAGLRLPFVVLGALAVGGLAAAVGAIGGRRAGLVAGGLAALAPAHVLLTQQVRGYAGLLVASSLLPWLVWRALGTRPATTAPADGGPARPDRSDVGLAFVAGLGLWSHATLALAILGWLAVALVAPRLNAGTRAGRAVVVRGLLLGLGLGLVLLASVLGRVLKHVRHAFEVGAPGRMGWSDLLDVVHGKGAGSFGPALGALLLLLAAAGLARALRRPSTRRAALVLAAPVLAAPLLVLASAPDYSRLVVFALPSLLGLVGLAAARPRARRPRARAVLGATLAVAAAGVAVALSAVVTARQAGEQLQDVRAAVTLARERVGPAGLVIGAGGGGELLSDFDPRAQDDIGWERALDAVQRPDMGPRQLVAVVVPLPAYTPPDVAQQLAGCCDPYLLPGVETPVVVWIVRDEW